MSVTGFGICGQKNSFSSRTKCGNWVEDRIGKVIAAKLKDAPRQAFGSTVERDDFIPPAMMTNNTVLPRDKTQMLSAAREWVQFERGWAIVFAEYHHHARAADHWRVWQDIKNKNREGVSFDLLFGHVRDSKHADALQQDRFLTNTQESFAPTTTVNSSSSNNSSTGGTTSTSTLSRGGAATNSLTAVNRLPPNQSRRARQRVAEVARERRQVEALTTTARLQGSRASW